MRPKFLSSRHSVHSCSPDYTQIIVHLQDNTSRTVCNHSSTSAEGLNSTASLPCFHCGVDRGRFSPIVYRPEHCGVYRGLFSLKLHRPEPEALRTGRFYPQEIPGVFPGGKNGRCVRLITLPPFWAIVT